MQGQQELFEFNCPEPEMSKFETNMTIFNAIKQEHYPNAEKVRHIPFKAHSVHWSDGENWHEFNVFDNHGSLWNLVLHYHISLISHDTHWRAVTTINKRLMSFQHRDANMALVECLLSRLENPDVHD